jgi:hypothetical protein
MKTFKELRSMGVFARLADLVLDFQKDNALSKTELVMLLQTLQCYLIDNIILDNREDER